MGAAADGPPLARVSQGDVPTQRRVLDAIRGTLRPGGLLVIGKTETLPEATVAARAEAAESPGRLLPVDAAHRIHRTPIA